MSAADNLTKKAYSKTPYTVDQIEELKKCMDPETGPFYFLENYMYIQHPTQGRLLFQPYPYQYDLIHSYHNYRKSVNLISRQMGKCVVASTNIRIRDGNKRVYDMPIGIFHEYSAAKRDGAELPDISSYAV